MTYKKTTMDRLEGCTNIITKKELMRYTNRVIISGSKSNGFNLSYEFFNNYLLELFEDDIKEKTQIVFMTALETTGAECFIIKFCKENNLAICPFEMNWEDKNGKFDKTAYYKRNEEMMVYATRLISFYDGNSKGQQQLLELAESSKLKRNIIRISKEENLND